MDDGEHRLAAKDQSQGTRPEGQALDEMIGPIDKVIELIRMSIGMADAAVRHQLQRPDLTIVLDGQQQHCERSDVRGQATSTISPYI
ncbi:hypothetical protein [Agrobacterium vitis]|uniref:hypothetical protein n=1 Tax=Agrobacterium vitis TaxID=373 RepID=UPI0008DC2A81|nr:hypothetical protein [Agrobacterium vitis]MUO85260.1 hypothetical protein [Agrobacterium vitis]